MGQLNSENNLQGKGIQNFGNKIRIGYFDNDMHAPGKYISFRSDGDSWVGECFKKHGFQWCGATQYKTDGTTEWFQH